MPPKRKMPPAKKAEKKTKSVESASPEAAGGDATEERYTFFYTVKSPFSQFYPAEFTVDGVKYMHAEQYMMHQKAGNDFGNIFVYNNVRLLNTLFFVFFKYFRSTTCQVFL